ncbi:MAG: hypothetical protein A2854_04155 [Parcubacteria group bacterium RIFCSPHIGHO2_01_FULL_56_18]|nr:MAG: hypothetical protein A2854_04155 [Parcubacteria group bacterium RIFCSPHIGHO2_01_FULL_56_18]
MQRYLIALVLVASTTYVHAEDEVLYKEKYGAWELVCRQPETQSNCVAVQSVQSADDATRWVKAELEHININETVLHIRLPRPNKKFNPRSIGGLGMGIDGENHGPLHLNEDVCEASECTVRWRLSGQYLVRLSRGKELTVAIPIDEKGGYMMSFSLDGFADVFLVLWEFRRADERLRKSK